MCIIIVMITIFIIIVTGLVKFRQDSFLSSSPILNNILLQNTWILSFIHPFIQQFTQSYTHSFSNVSNHSFSYLPYMHSLTHLFRFTCPVIYPTFYLAIHLSIHSFIPASSSYSFILSFNSFPITLFEHLSIQKVTHPYIHSYTHPAVYPIIHF